MILPIKERANAMFNILSFNFAINAMLILLGSVIVFHLLIITQLLPYNIVGGGNLKNVAEMRIFESTSVIIIAFMMCVIAIKARYVRSNRSSGIINILLWLFILFFIVNTIGNLLAKATIETIVFTPVTFISAILCFRIVKEKTKVDAFSLATPKIL